MDETNKDEHVDIGEHEENHQISEHPERPEDGLLDKQEETSAEPQQPQPTKKQLKKALELKRKKERDERRKKYFTAQDKLSRLEKYEDDDSKHKLNKVFQGKAEFKGPVGTS